MAMETAKQFILDENQQFLAVSLGIGRDDLLELIRWSAEKNDLVFNGGDAISWNFHPLPSGNYCLSQTFRLETRVARYCGKASHRDPVAGSVAGLAFGSSAVSGSDSASSGSASAPSSVSASDSDSASGSDLASGSKLASGSELASGSDLATVSASSSASDSAADAAVDSTSDAVPESVSTVPFRPQPLFTHGILVSAQLLQDDANNAVSLMKHLARLGFWQAGVEVTRQLWQSSLASQESSEKEPSSPEKTRESQEPSKQSAMRKGTSKRGAQVRRTVPVLRQVPLDGGAEVVHLHPLRMVVSYVGVRRFATILDSALTHVTTILEGRAPVDLLLEALLDMLPVSCRCEFSFSTGLRFSPERPFRIVGLGDSGDASAEALRIRASYHLPILSTDSEGTTASALPAMRHRWAMFVATVLEQGLEQNWQETALLDTNVPMTELSKRARRYFRQYGLDVIYQKLSEMHRQKSPLDQQAYRVFQMQVPTLDDAKQEMRNVLFSSAEPTESPQVPVSPSSSSSSSSELHRHYTTAISEAMHGNPLAGVHLQDSFRKITQSAPESTRDEVSDGLLAEGLRQWNAERASTPNHSWKQVENMVDTLTDMLTLWGESKEV